MDEHGICRIASAAMSALQANVPTFGCIRGVNVTLLVSSFELDNIAQGTVRDKLDQAAYRSGTNLGLVRFL